MRRATMARAAIVVEDAILAVAGATLETAQTSFCREAASYLAECLASEKGVRAN